MIDLKTNTDSFIKRHLPAGTWKRFASSHKERISEFIDDYLERRQHQHKDPILDFLFEYYAFPPSHLKRWSPGFGILLEGDDFERLELSELHVEENGAFLHPNYFSENRKDSVRWILNLLESSANSAPHFGCFGMHEWAMVYKRDTVRHEQIPLRMSRQELADFVESRPLVCTHFDAFRFFSEDARPMNKHKLSRKNFVEMEQPACVHTNMDLYKWAFKFYPWISSELIRNAFEMALEARVVDMKASPYDLREYGLDPIKIETEKGRKEYLERQKEIFAGAQPIRRKLIEAYRDLAAYFNC